MIRIGTAYDAHRLVEDRALILGGVEIPYEKGLLGHSDADVLVHVIMDAMLGALALGSIGDFFPDTDEKYKDSDSMVLLDEIIRVMTSKGYSISNIDSTIVAQAPKLAPHITEIRRSIADRIGLDIDLVSVKATTTEKMGFEGSGEGISAHAAVLLSSDQ